MAYLPDIEVGDYAIVHVGFAISKVDEASALETLQMFRDLGILEEELGIEPDEVLDLRESETLELQESETL